MNARGAEWVSSKYTQAFFSGSMAFIRDLQFNCVVCYGRGKHKSFCDADFQLLFLFNVRVLQNTVFERNTKLNQNSNYVLYLGYNLVIFVYSGCRSSTLFVKKI